MAGISRMWSPMPAMPGVMVATTRRPRSGERLAMHHLHQPPHGYEWVQSGGQYVMIAVASGIIADVVVNALMH